MGVRVWGVAEDRLFEVRVGPASSGDGIRIEGLPDDRARTTADRLRAALLNSGLIARLPPMALAVEPPAGQAPTSDLDLALAVAALVHIGTIGVDLRWILAVGRLGLDGTVHGPGLEETLGLGSVVESLCQTPVVQSERMFEKGSE